MMVSMFWWQRLDQRRSELGWNKAEMARRTGIPYDNINKYLRGEVENPRGDTLEALAKAIKRPLAWLRDGTEVGENDVTPSAGKLVAAAIVGRVEAGSFREIDEFDQSEQVLISVPADERFPHARMLVFDVSGDSMNDLSPRPILDGDRIVCVAYEDVAHEAVLRDRMVVVVERTRDGGQTREWSVKQVEIYQDRTEFHPRSTNPKHKPIVIYRDVNADDGVKVEIIALARSIQNDLTF